MDVRTATSLPGLVPLIEQLRSEGVRIRPIFLDASTDALVRRFSETRRPHPLTAAAEGGDSSRGLIEAIELERELLAADHEVGRWSAGVERDLCLADTAFGA